MIHEKRGMAMKNSYSIFGKTLAFSLLCFAFLLPAGECALGAESISWEKNKADIGIYQTELSDFYEISFGNPDTGISERTFERDVKNGIRLLMINGGFVPEPDTVLQNGIIYAPLEKIAEPLGITYDLTRQEGKYLTLQKGDTTLVFPRYNESTVLLNGHEMAASYYLCDYDHLYVPLRFVAETFGGKVQYVDDYEKTFCNEDNSEFPNRVKVNVIAIEMPDGIKPQYVSKDGMEKIIDVSVQYQQDLIAAREEANQKIEEKFYYDASAVTYTGKKLGRFYVYELKEFENFPIYFNEYTGEIYSKAVGLPLVGLDKHFINIGFMLS